MRKKVRVKSRRHSFNTVVDAELWEEANRARGVIGKTWVNLLEDMFRATIAVANMRRAEAKARKKEARA